MVWTCSLVSKAPPDVLLHIHLLNIYRDEMAQYDVPGMLDYILSVTNHSKVAYVGHSQVATLCLCAEYV